jgi:TonB family protein
MSERSHAAGQAPSSIGRYEITGTLGFGAMGAVYRAFDPIIKRSLAIKTIRVDVPRQSPQHQAFIERFYQEARISGTLSHPNIVTLFDIGEENGVPFLAMEFVDGQTIAEALEKGERFKPEKVLGLVSQIAAALDYAHSRGVVHRDIKPSNLIVQEGDRIKVTDFGIAKLVDAEITLAGTLLGTPSYMSPEQAMGEPLDGRSDLFSLGVCAFEMLSGQQPFPGNNVTSILYKLVHVDPVEPGDLELNGLVPHKWREVFHKVLAKQPENRYESGGAFVRDLELCLGSWFTGLGEETLVMPTPDESTVTLAEAPHPVELSRDGSADFAGEDSEATVRLSTAETGGTSPAETETVVLAAPSEMGRGPDDSGTVGLESRPAGADDTVALPPSAPPGEPTPDATVSLDAATATQPPVLPPPARERRPLPVGTLLAAAAALFVLAATVVGWLLWQRGAVSSRPVVAQRPLPDAPAPPTPFPSLGTLRVSSQPEGARVSLNGEERGSTPLELAEVPFGVYEVQIELEGYETTTRDVSLNAGSPTAQVAAALARRRPPVRLGTAGFASTPEGAEVVVDGRSVGRTPLDGVRLPPGTHRVEISLAEHETWSGRVKVASGQEARVVAELVAVAPPAPPPPPPVDTTKVYENKPGQVDQVARKRAGDSPSYPKRAPRLKSGERVSVTFTFLVTEAGEVRDVEVMESAGQLVDDVVVEAVRTWRYDPARIRGTPVRVRVVRKQTFLGG